MMVRDLASLAARRGSLMLLSLLLNGAFLQVCTAQAQQVSGVGPISRYQGHGLRLEIQALAGDQIRAFMLGRGFSSADADWVVANGCIFRSQIGNQAQSAAAPTVHIALNDWEVHPVKPSQDKAKPKPLWTREKWQAIWARRPVPEGAKIAFHWGLFPTRQSHAPADYNWGFLSFGLPAKSRFDLTIRWQVAGQTFTHHLKGLVCGE